MIILNVVYLYCIKMAFGLCNTTNDCLVIVQIRGGGGDQGLPHEHHLLPELREEGGHEALQKVMELFFVLAPCSLLTRYTVILLLSVFSFLTVN